MVSISFKYRQEKDKDIIRERYFSIRTQMFFFSLCVVPVDLPICVAETALNESLNRVQPCSQGSLLLVEGENPGNMVEQGIYFYYWLDVFENEGPWTVQGQLYQTAQSTFTVPTWYQRFLKIYHVNLKNT